MNAQTAKITPGKWIKVSMPGSCDEIRSDDGPDSTIICEFPYGFDGGSDAANADLIIEAGNVYHETGLWPRQLADQRAELLEALRKYRELEKKFPFHGSKEDLDEVYRVRNGADAAIQRATGE